MFKEACIFATFYTITNNTSSPFPGNEDSQQNIPKHKITNDKPELAVAKRLDLEQKAENRVEVAEISSEKAMEIAVNPRYLDTLQISQSQDIDDRKTNTLMPALKPVEKRERELSPEELCIIEFAAETTVESQAETKVEHLTELGIGESIEDDVSTTYRSISDISSYTSTTSTNTQSSIITFVGNSVSFSKAQSISNDKRLKYEMAEEEAERSRAEENERIRIELVKLEIANLQAVENARLQAEKNEFLRREAEREAQSSRAEENERIRDAVATQNVARLQAENNARLQAEANEFLRGEAEREAQSSRDEENERLRDEVATHKIARLRAEEIARLHAEENGRLRREVEKGSARFHAEQKSTRFAAAQELQRVEIEQAIARSKAEEERQRLLAEFEKIANRQARQDEYQQTEVARVSYVEQDSSMAPRAGKENVRLQAEDTERLLIKTDQKEMAKTQSERIKNLYANPYQTEENARKSKSKVGHEELKYKYGERAFTILLDLGMIIIHPDPDSPDYDHRFDSDIVPSGEWI